MRGRDATRATGVPAEEDARMAWLYEKWLVMDDWIAGCLRMQTSGEHCEKEDRSHSGVLDVFHHTALRRMC